MPPYYAADESCSTSAATSSVLSCESTITTGSSTCVSSARMTHMIESMRRRYDAREERRMKIAPVRTEADYDTALREIGRLMDAKPRSPGGDRLDVLVTLVEAYEQRRWRIDAPDPIDALKIRM